MPLFSAILSLIFPSKCVVCGRSGEDLCLKCLKDCPSAERESASWTFPVFDYRHPPVKKALWLFKYNGKRNLAKILAEPLYESMIEELSDKQILENFNLPLLTPIPLSRKRRRERGYNQSELLAKEIIRVHRERGGMDIELGLEVLTKPKETEHQARIKDRQKRQENLKGTFVVNKPEEVKGRNIILIDDILTTGATLTEAKRALKAVGARKVIAFTVAH